jgi:pyruvate-formate lyase-activating enzyme
MSKDQKVRLAVVRAASGIRTGVSNLLRGQSTFCPRLWSEAFIDDKANVFFCCHSQPYAIGNLQDAPLSELWHGLAAKQARQMSLHRGLACFAGCTLLDERERAMEMPSGPASAPAYSELKRVKIMMGELCNIACIMCHQDHRSRRQLSTALLRERVDFSNIDRIELFGGEPMALANAKETYVWLTEELGKKVNFLTNGTLMPEGWAERIARGSDWIYFSLNGVSADAFERVNFGAKQERVLRNVERVREARDRLGTPLEIVAHFTMVPENVEEVDLFPDFAKRIGADRADFGFDVAVPAWLERHPEVKQRLKSSFARLMLDPPLPMSTHRLTMVGLIAGKMDGVAPRARAEERLAPSSGVASQVDGAE